MTKFQILFLTFVACAVIIQVKGLDLYRRKFYDAPMRRNNAIDLYDAPMIRKDAMDLYDAPLRTDDKIDLYGLAKGDQRNHLRGCSSHVGTNPPHSFVNFGELEWGIARARKPRTFRGQTITVSFNIIAHVLVERVNESKKNTCRVDGSKISLTFLC
ncbi:hypothetical protein AWC38_SpisGene2738 [Stylophora pistillata]|uniref:Uncharacterized protein n=1 Tax=Stylophora pistillata TaxID=50429 RepID=A0A2B4SVA8_STYPI|nr:hypothetical protein AWC38_SpisGene2738 [Stylophora pistillata]